MKTTAVCLPRIGLCALALLFAACDGVLSAIMPDEEECCSPAPAFHMTAFPLPNRTHMNVQIGSVFDHSMSTPYCADERIVAFTGESADGSQPRRKVVTFSCGDLYGFRKTGGGNFKINGNYTGSGTPDFLYYDGHPAYDYRTSDLCPATLTTATEICPLPGKVGRVRLQAAAAGVVACSDFDGRGDCPEGPGVVKIRHQNDYHTIYMHMESASVQTGDTIASGQAIGVAGGRGNTGPNDFSPHLHFEVRKGTVPVDPYGWEPKDQADPYKLAVNFWMW